MTYKEKYYKDHDSKSNPIHTHCPCSYGYENLPDNYSEGNCIHPTM